MKRAEPRKHLTEMMEDFETVMLVTRDVSGELRARPMQRAAAMQGETAYFATNRSTGKTFEIERDANVSLVMQSATQFVSVTGKAMVVSERSKIDQLWNEKWKVWFPKGATDPDLVLLEVRMVRAEFWDMSGANLLSYAWDAAKAYVSGGKSDAEVNDKLHGVVGPPPSR